MAAMARESGVPPKSLTQFKDTCSLGEENRAMLERCLLSPNLKDDAFVPIARQLSALVDLALATGISPKVRLEHLRASLTSLFKVIESVEKGLLVPGNTRRG